MSKRKNKTMYRKKIGLLLFSAFFCLFLCVGCGLFSISSQTSSNTESKDIQKIQSVEAEEKQSEGELYDTGDFSVMVADGWVADVPVRQMKFPGQTAKYITVPSNLLLIPAEDIDMENRKQGPHIRIIFDNSTSEQMPMDKFLEQYEKTEMSPVTLNGISCDAFQADIRGVDYEVITYPQDGCRFYIYVAVGIEGEKTGVTWNNPDVKGMLESLVADNAI